MSDVATKNEVHPATVPTSPTYPETAPDFKSALAAPGMDKVWALMNWFYDTRVGRMLNRYSMGKGGLLAGGIAYMSMFSIAAALTIGITVFMMVIGNNEQLRNSVFDAISQGLPGVLEWNGQNGILRPEQLVIDTGFSIGGIIATAVLIFSATYVMSALKWSIRQMFGIVALPSNYLVDLARDLFGFLVMAAGVILTAVAGIITSTAGDAVLSWLGITGGFAKTMIAIAGLIAAALIDGLVLFMLVRFVACVRVPWPDMWRGLLIGVIGSAILRYAGTTLVGSVKSPLLASFAALVTILLWVNLLARVTLYMCSFMANPPRSSQALDAVHLHADETPNYVTVSHPQTLAWPHQSLTGTLEPDLNNDPSRVVPQEPEPRWGGLIGRYYNWQIERHKRRAVEYYKKLYR